MIGNCSESISELVLRRRDWWNRVFIWVIYWRVAWCGSDSILHLGLFINVPFSQRGAWLVRPKQRRYFQKRSMDFQSIVRGCVHYIWNIVYYLCPILPNWCLDSGLSFQISLGCKDLMLIYCGWNTSCLHSVPIPPGWFYISSMSCHQRAHGGPGTIF